MKQTQFTNATLSANGQKLELRTDGLGTLGIQVVGIMSATLQIEGTINGKDWFALNAIPVASNTPVTSITAATVLFANVSSLIAARLRCSSYTSGTPTMALVAVEEGKSERAGSDIISGIYNVTAPTLTDGTRTSFQLDVNGNLKDTLATKLAGEDLTNDIMKVEERFSYSPVAVADVQVKSGAGYLHSITISCNDAAPTAGSLIVYDSLTETGTQIFNHTFTTTPFVPFTVFFDVSFSTGLYLGFTTTADVNVTTSYR